MQNQGQPGLLAQIEKTAVLESLTRNNGDRKASGRGIGDQPPHAAISPERIWDRREPGMRFNLRQLFISTHLRKTIIDVRKRQCLFHGNIKIK